MIVSLRQSEPETPIAERTPPRPDLDLRLLRRTQVYLRCLQVGRAPGAGSRRAWEEFYRLHSPSVRRVVTTCGLRGQDAEDCTQEVWTVIVRALAREAYRPHEGRFCCWLLSVIRHRVIDFVRAEARKRPILSPNLEGVTCCDRLDPVSVCQRDQQRDLVLHVLGHLRAEVSTSNYQIVHLRWLKGQDLSQVAGRLHLTSEQVRYRHYRVKKRLRALFQSHGQETL